MDILMRNDIKDKVYELIGDVLAYSVEGQLEDAKLIELGINSFNFVKLCVKIEEELDIQFELKEMNLNNEIFITIQSLIDYIVRRKYDIHSGNNEGNLEN
jgi:acyl carrier protein